MDVPPGAPDAPLDRPMRQTALAHIEGEFPGVLCWWGRHTCRWWAYVPSARGGRLLEATTPNALVLAITSLVVRGMA